MHSITEDQILENLDAIHRYAVKHKKWDLALDALERQAKHLGFFEDQHYLSRHLPKVTLTARLVKQQTGRFGDEEGRVGDELEHPPPSLRT